MQELIEAAKAVIDTYDYTGPEDECIKINELIEAVELAEKPSADFMVWWKTFPLNTYGIVPAFHGWEAGQQAERKRIKDIICEVTGGFGNCDRLMEKIDDVS